MHPAPSLSRTSSPASGRRSRPRTILRVVEGGAVHDSDHEGLHIELVAARAERTVLDDKLRGRLRSAIRLIAAGHVAAASTYLEECSRLVEQDALRATSMEAPCACGIAGVGHGPADDEAIAA